MGDFSEHVKILIFALFGFMVAFVIAYSVGWERLWIPLFISIIVLFMIIAILAKSGEKIEINQSD